MSEKPLIIALSKGRILDETLPLLKHAGIELLEDPSASRKLIFDTTRDDVQIIIIRATDVPPYVQHGGADMGVAGKDVLMENGAEGIFEPLDLEIARCKLMVAALKDAPPVSGRLRVATKFVNVARQYFAQQGKQAEIIKLYWWGWRTASWTSSTPATRCAPTAWSPPKPSPTTFPPGWWSTGPA